MFYENIFSHITPTLEHSNSMLDSTSTLTKLFPLDLEHSSNPNQSGPQPTISLSLPDPRPTVNGPSHSYPNPESGRSSPLIHLYFTSIDIYFSLVDSFQNKSTVVQPINSVPLNLNSLEPTYTLDHSNFRPISAQFLLGLP